MKPAFVPAIQPSDFDTLMKANTLLKMFDVPGTASYRHPTTGRVEYDHPFVFDNPNSNPRFVFFKTSDEVMEHVKAVTSLVNQ